MTAKKVIDFTKTIQKVIAEQKKLKSYVAGMDKLSRSKNITNVDLLKLDDERKTIDLETALPNMFKRGRVAQEVATMVKALKTLQESQAKTPEAIPEAQNKQTEAIRQQLSAIKAQSDVHSDVINKVGAVKNGIDDQAGSVNRVIERVDALSDSWRGVASAMNGTNSGMSLQMQAAGGLIQQLANGGLARGFDVGGFVSSGTDTIPAMLSPGERITNAESSRRFASQLTAINAGIKPIFRSEGGNVTNIGDINVTVSGGGSSHQTARSIAVALKRELRRGTATL